MKSSWYHQASLTIVNHSDVVLAVVVVVVCHCWWDEADFMHVTPGSC